jgi:hypothetical protein
MMLIPLTIDIKCEMTRCIERRSSRACIAHLKVFCGFGISMKSHCKRQIAPRDRCRHCHTEYFCSFSLITLADSTAKTSPVSLSPL